MAQPREWTIQDARRLNKLSRNGNVQYYLDLVGDDGSQASDVYRQAAASTPMAPGEQIYGRVEPGDYGLRFFAERRDGEPWAENGGPAEDWQTVPTERVGAPPAQMAQPELAPQPPERVRPPGSPPPPAPQSQPAPQQMTEGDERESYWRRRERRDEIATVRMGRAHAQEMAILVAALLPGEVKERGLGTVVEEWTDYFEADVRTAGERAE